MVENVAIFTFKIRPPPSNKRIWESVIKSDINNCIFEINFAYFIENFDALI